MVFLIGGFGKKKHD